MAGWCISDRFDPFNQKQAARDRGYERTSQLLKGDLFHLGGFEVSCGGVGIFLKSLCEGPFCVGIVGQNPPVSPGKEVYS